MIQGLIVGPFLAVAALLAYRAHKDIPLLAVTTFAIAILGFAWLLVSIAQLTDRVL